MGRHSDGGRQLAHILHPHAPEIGNPPGFCPGGGSEGFSEGPAPGLAVLENGVINTPYPGHSFLTAMPLSKMIPDTIAMNAGRNGKGPLQRPAFPEPMPEPPRRGMPGLGHGRERGEFLPQMVFADSFHG
jgi:hypothetical protein